VRVEALGYFARSTKAQVEPRQTVRIELSVTRKPSKPGILLMPDGTVQAPGIVWSGEAVELSPTAESAVAELAELLLMRPDLNVRIQGYGSELVARPRADVIRQRLIAAGVEAHRVEALGGGKQLRISLRP
jgi:outer membrane protein OmpA-like peptidoglycan-associated protein